jgi:solute carrier family 8 (sodium/calcium exchanger)
LIELFNSCQVCGHKTEAEVSQVQGSYVAVSQICDCGHKRRWDSQPKVHGVPAGNIQLSAGILSLTKFLPVFNFINIMCVTVNTYFHHQKIILWSAIETTWNNNCVRMMRTLRERGGEVVVAGDGRVESPWHCAKYGVYSLIDMNSGQVIGLHLV